PPGARGPPFTSWVLEMITTEGATCSASPEKSGRLTDGAGVPAPPPLGFSAPPKMLIASLCGNRSRRALRTTPTAKPISATATIARRPVRGVISPPSCRLAPAPRSACADRRAPSRGAILHPARGCFWSSRGERRGCRSRAWPPRGRARGRDRLIGTLRARRRALGRRRGWRRGRLLGEVGARLSAVGETPAVPHLEPASLLLVFGHECPRPPARVSTPSRAAAGCAPRWGDEC